MDSRDYDRILDHASQGGMYSPSAERDACGVGFVAHIKGKARHALSVRRC